MNELIVVDEIKMEKELCIPIYIFDKNLEVNETENYHRNVHSKPPQQDWQKMNTLYRSMHGMIQHFNTWNTTNVESDVHTLTMAIINLNRAKKILSYTELELLLANYSKFVKLQEVILHYTPHTLHSYIIKNVCISYKLVSYLKQVEGPLDLISKLEELFQHDGNVDFDEYISNWANRLMKTYFIK